jgi:diaminopimelate epimerase
MVASGNDFVLVRQFASSPVRQLKKIAKDLCNRRFGIGADGLLLLEKSKIADTKMLIFNPDGSEARMCGNGARCVALFTKHQTPNTKHLKIETKAGTIEAKVKGNDIKIKFTEPKDLKLDLPIIINGITRHVSFINTGVPHTVIFVSGLDEIDVVGIGKLIRHHKKFSPQGTNVNFVEIIDEDNIKLRTYERGVEDETLACGTGAVAAALILATRYSLLATHKINVHTKSGEILKVYFEKINHKFKNVWLEGKAKIVYKGEYYV